VVRLDRIEAPLLERVGGDLVGKPDAAALLPEVEKDAAPLLLQEAQAYGKLFTAVAARRPENVARQALRVRTNQDRLAVVDRSYSERHVFFVIGGVVDEHLKGAVTGRKIRFGNPTGRWRDHILPPLP
jgi:hypothetical protein